MSVSHLLPLHQAFCVIKEPGAMGAMLFFAEHVHTSIVHRSLVCAQAPEVAGLT